MFEELPKILYLGQSNGQYQQYHGFKNLDEATYWIARDPRNRRIWMVDLANLRKMEYIPPSKPYLKETEE